jgi:hypothetical protein
MARINVEDEWFVDKTKRRSALKRALEQQPRDVEREADGMALDAWRLSQHYWLDGERLIPEEVWQCAALEPLIDCGLAERRPKGIYIRGSRDRHEWILQRVNAGKARAKGSRDDRGRLSSEKTGEHPAAAGFPLDNSPAGIQRRSSGDPAGHQPPILLSSIALKTESIPRGSATDPPGPADPAGEPDPRPTEGAPLIPEPPKDRCSAFDHALAARWATEHAALIMPRLKPKLDKWADALRLMRTRDGLTEEEILEVFAFVKVDDFWKTNGISPETLRTKSKNGLKKIENVILAMKTRPVAKVRPMHLNPIV